MIELDRTTGWPPNKYLVDWLRTADGQEYLRQHGNLEKWRRAHAGEVAESAKEAATPAQQDAWFF